MKFGEFPIDECLGAILAHSLYLDGRLILKKGTVLEKDHLEKIGSFGHEKLTIAKLSVDDVEENEAARRVAECFLADGLYANDASTGRVNILAEKKGLFLADRELINKINLVHPDITVATLNEFAFVEEGGLVATVKIIPYGVDKKHLEKIEAIEKGAIGLAPFKAQKVSALFTDNRSLKESVKRKTEANLKTRIEKAGSVLMETSYIDHELGAVSHALDEMIVKTDLVILFGAGAISDLEDVIPKAVISIGGKIERFGMPVDPGNLLLIGSKSATKIIGAPSCARSIAENGFDFVLQRLLAGIEVSSNDIAKMGVGGLLHEIPSRPHPRQAKTNQVKHVAGIVLAAGQSKRMGKANKLLETVSGKPLISHIVEASNQSQLDQLVVVTGHQGKEVRSELGGFVKGGKPHKFLNNPDYEMGLSSSLITGIKSLDRNVTHAMILLGDMPLISNEIIDELLETIDSNPPNSIIMATAFGKWGNPILWPRCYFDALLELKGDVGAKHIIFENSEHVIEVEIGEAAALDIDLKTELNVFEARSSK